ncbi:ABC transporter permease [Herbiconiux ginsengi]|uniref:ABC-type nitrate/sulfonate/bicarbonate transport system, permease component n=1 Tax=Herbiconiux ginsengi TaxID=381665 RepID=A0A1H3T6X9_9MICO|nr:ABC transporter permease subunit [Herbiconiux ginsengi]SDZ45611.1 ABC-type nitrate/sulfonate/bicarbonate transport system, permease component [Herbiconiux ginsengi]
MAAIASVAHVRENRTNSWRSLRPYVVPITSVVVFALIYEFAISGVLVSETYLPGIPSILNALVGILLGPYLWSALGSTIGIAFGGFLIGGGLGIVLGLVSGRNLYIYRALRFTVEFLRSTPAVAMIPLVVLMLGPTDNARIFLVAFTVFPPLYIQAVYGVQDTNPVAIETAQSYRLGRWGTLGRVVLPSAGGYLATAIRIFIVISVLVSVSTELILGGGSGVGSMLRSYSQVGNYPAMYAMVLIIGALGMLLVFAMNWIERIVLFWHPSHREDVS